jgi:hypothetical protein
MNDAERKEMRRLVDFLDGPCVAIDDNGSEYNIDTSSAHELLGDFENDESEIQKLRSLLFEVWDAAPYLGGDLNRRIREALNFSEFHEDLE